MHPLSTSQFFSTEVAHKLWSNGKQIWLWRTPRVVYFRPDPQGEGQYGSCG